MLKKVTYEYMYDLTDAADAADAFEFEVELMNADAHYTRAICGNMLIISVVENWREADYIWRKGE